MIVFALFGLAAIGYRGYRRMLTRAELIAVVVALVCVVMVVVQQYAANRIFPESRYWIQATLIFYPWGIWGIMHFWKLEKFRVWHALIVIMSLFALIDVITLIKVLVPGSRRNAYVAACDWAVEQIRADWRGPSRDPEFVYSRHNYNPPYRPSVEAHVRRVPYLLGGRRYSQAIDRELGMPFDYWIEDLRRETPPTEADGCELMGEYKRGKYRFQLWKRK